MGTENPRVGSSILSLGTTKKLSPCEAIRRGFLHVENPPARRGGRVRRENGLSGGMPSLTTPLH